MEQIPLLKVSGSLTDLGWAIGLRFKVQIQARVKATKQSIPNYSKYLDEIKTYLKFVKDFFPESLKELEVMAESAGVDFLDLAFLNTHEVYPYTGLNPDKPLRCTSVVSFNINGAIVGHNEDWLLAEQDDLYLLKGDIKGRKFIGLNYCCELAGITASLSSSGIVQCVDELDLKIGMGVPRNFLAHALLTCQNFANIESFINKAPRASGYNYLLVKDSEVWDIETSFHSNHIEKMSNCCYVHTNHCLYPQTKQFEKNCAQGSLDRLQKATALVKKPMGEDEMADLLSATQASRFSERGEIGTLASVLILPGKGEFKVKPNHSKSYLTYTF